MNKFSNNTKNMYILVGIIFLFAFGVTYAYFEVVLREYSPNQIVTETGKLELNYVDGDFVIGNNIYPGWNANKTVSVTNIGTLGAYYKIFWKELTNNVSNDELVLSAVCTSYEHYGEEEQVISGVCEDIPKTPVATVASTIKDQIGINAGYTHVYSFTFEFIETSTVQNYNQGKVFSGVINIDESIGAYTMNITLLDEVGNIKPNAHILLNDTFEGYTDSNGKLVFEDVPEGSYRIFINDNQSDIILSNGLSVGSNDNLITSNVDNDTINVVINMSSSITYLVSSASEYDVNMLALYVDGVKVTSLSNDKNYLLISSACTNGETVEWNNNGHKITIFPLTTSTKCTINFNERSYPTIIESMNISSSRSDESINFGVPTTSNLSDRGLFYTSDLTKTKDGQRVYYYRGPVTNNYVLFAGYCFRIVRTNEDGSVRLRFGGSPSGGVCPETGVNVSIGEIKFNSTYNDNAFVGYMMGLNNACAEGSSCTTTIHSTSYSLAHANSFSSNIKNYIDDWYHDNIVSKGVNVTSKIANAIYCADRNVGNAGTITDTRIFTSNAFGTNDVLYSATRRISTGGPNGTTWSRANALPQYKCNNEASDGFTLSTVNGGVNGYGNNKLAYPVGLLTSDEASYAGTSQGSGTSATYLYTGQDYWLMTPFYVSGERAGVYVIYANGSFGANYVSDDGAILPVISILGDTIVSAGTGEYNKPFIIE